MISSTTETSSALYKSQDAENTAETPENPQTETVPENGDFRDAMLKIMGTSESSSVNEEELFAGLIEQQLEEQNPEAAAAYRSAKDRLMGEMARGDGYVPVEDVANAALDAVVAEGLIDAETASGVRSTSFRAAQLDDNLEALYDGRGLDGDETIAIASMEEALLKMSQALAGIESGEIDPAEAEVATPLPTTGPQELDGDGGFLWKPVSEKDENLVVLLPTELRGLIERVEIHSELPAIEDTLLATGQFAGDDHNGERVHYRFDEPGEAYGTDVHVVAYTSSGEQLSWAIANGAERQD